MPFSDLLRMAKGKADPVHQKTSPFSTDPSSGADNDFFELVWENGQIMMQGQSSRARKAPTSNNLSPVVSKPRDGKDTSNSKMAKFGTVDPLLSDFPLSAPSCEMGFNQDVDMVPWLSYPVAEPLNNECCSDLLPELSGVNVNGLSTGNNLPSMEKSSFSYLMTADHSKSTTNALNSRQVSPSKAMPSAGETNRSRDSDVANAMPRSGIFDTTCSDVANAKHVDSRNSFRCRSHVGGSSSLNLHNKHEEGYHRNNDSSFMNFSYFSRFASSPRVNNRNSVGTSGALPCSTKRLGNDDKGGAMNSSHPMESTLVNPDTGCSRQESNSRAQSSLPPLNVVIESRAPNPFRDSFPPQQSGAICLEDNAKNDKPPKQASGSATARAVIGGEKITEPVVAASSLCSCNSLERASNDPAGYLKRKTSETFESESPTEEVEEESVGVTKTAAPRAKRSRAAEVHTLSERRRRDRINEKMRALQELIPNCNKADKASMLDEAIEYLKTLQLQVQMLSMGTGLYMPPMMVPAAMQHIHRAQMPHFPPMPIGGIGMGLGFGMGMHELNNSTMQMPPMPGPCYPLPGFPQISSSSTFHGLPGSANQGFVYPGQGLHMPMPHLPLPPLDNSTLKLPMGNVNANGNADGPHVAPSTISKDVQNVGLQVIRDGNNANGPMNQESAQCSRDVGGERGAAEAKGDRRRRERKRGNRERRRLERRLQRNKRLG